jgi:hypothetical protein
VACQTPLAPNEYPWAAPPSAHDMTKAW